jgi:pyruvate/2-oxoglutarate dehydrogenase complex dihydrolipoamide acyltransferase (E2) component
MAEYKDLIIPTININDNSVTVSDIQKSNLEYIEEGDMLYCVETSKATEEYYVDFSGYVVLYVEDMDEVKVGESAGMIFKNLDDAKVKLSEVVAAKAQINKQVSVNASKKALEYAKQLCFDITLIKKDGLIKTDDIDNYLAAHK